MARPDSIFEKGLRAHVDAGREDQNGYGYDDLVRFFAVPRYIKRGQPSYAAVGDLMNRDGQTIKKWWIQYQLEQGARK